MKRYDKLLSKREATNGSRRDFLKMTAASVGGAVLVGFSPETFISASASAANEGVKDVMMNPFVKIEPNGKIIVLIKHLDKGQGIATGLASLVAEELDALPEQIDIEFAPSDEKYNNLFWGVQGTGGSTSIANSFEQYRQAGAAARLLLVKAASRRWNIAVDEIMVSNGTLTSGQLKASFADLAGQIVPEPLPQNIALKAPEDWKFIGKGFPRVDVRFKSNGAIDKFTMDQQSDDCVIATVVRPPKWGAKRRKFNAEAAKQVKGVIAIKAVDESVAVYAQSTWAAIKAKRLIEVEWDFTLAENRSTQEILDEYKTKVSLSGDLVERRGQVDHALSQAAEIVELDYEFPFLAHAPMEPLDTIVLLEDEKATIWTGSQIPTLDQNMAATTLELEADQVTIIPLWAGGSFGRRAVYNSDFVVEAVKVAKAFGKSQPVKTVWTREDDIRGGYYRPLYVHKAKLAFNDSGDLIGWQHHVVGQTITKGTAFGPFFMHEGKDLNVLEGLLHTTYEIPNFSLAVTETTLPIPALWWRSVGHSHTACVIETVVDYAAAKAGKDPVDYRRTMMKNDPRKRGVLDLVVKKSGWYTPLPLGRFRGVAVHKSFDSYVAQVAEISIKDGQVKVEKVWCTVDCGVPVNPDNIKAQIEGGIGYGLGAILRNEITLTNGYVDQDNFDTYNPLRMEDMPDIEVHIVPSSEKPTGIGEPGVPPIGPAVLNAIFAATGSLPTVMPLSKSGLAI